MMKMLDKFMLLIADCETSKDFRSPIKTWKIIYRKSGIIKEIKNKKSFSPEDLCNYGWIIRWAKEKWKDNFTLPKGFSIRGVDNFYFYEYISEGRTLFAITAKNFPSITEVKIDIHHLDRSVSIIHSESGILENEWDLEWVQDIMREFIVGTISSIITRIIRGD